MGFRARKSIRITKGVRLNLSKTGVGMSVGGRGVRHSVHSSGRRTSSVGIPGSGVSWQSTTSRGTKGRSSASQGRRGATPPTTAIKPPSPGVFAAKGEKALHKALVSSNVAAVEQVARDEPNYRLAANFLVGMDAQSKGDAARAEQWLRSVVDAGTDVAADPFIRKYLTGAAIPVEIAEGVSAELPISQTTAILMLGEALQALGRVEDAAAMVEGVPDPDIYAALSLAELYLDLGRFDDVVALTTGLSNEDDVTALLHVFRGSAFRHLGHYDAAREALKESMRSKKRSPQVLNLALSERAETYVAQNRKAQARKDLERILAANPTYPGLTERLAAL